jgi:phosphonate metabolism-associated iron-containing alcohol dehydrogenase
MPTQIVCGKNSFNTLDKYIKSRKTLLVTSSGFVKRGLVNKCKLLTNNIVDIVSEVTSHPEFKDLERIYSKIKNIDFELILAIGGGSVLDAAKFFSVQNYNKEYEFVKDIIKRKRPSESYKCVPIISVPTTAGTGSELTPWATIWNMEEKAKYSLQLPELFSEIAIYDPILTLSVPKNITIQTGLDTLSHALESIWNRNASPITVNYAKKAVILVMSNLPLLVEDLANVALRDALMKSSMFAGLAFSNTQTAIAHAISYYMTVHKGIAHGIACSFTLPMLIDRVVGEYEFIDEAFQEIFGEVSSVPLRQMLKNLGVATEFRNYGIDKEGFEELKLSLGSNQRVKNSLVNI